jgi:hypothetical protein
MLLARNASDAWGTLSISQSGAKVVVFIGLPKDSVKKCRILEK